MQTKFSKFVPYLLMGIEEEHKFAILKIKKGCVKSFYGQGSFQREIGAKEEF